MNDMQSTPWISQQYPIVSSQDHPPHLWTIPGHGSIPTPTQSGIGREYLLAPILSVVHHKKRFFKRFRRIFTALIWIGLLMISLLFNVALAYLTIEMFTNEQMWPGSKNLIVPVDVWSNRLPCHGRNYRPNHPKAVEDGVCVFCSAKVDVISAYTYGSPPNDICCYPQQDSTLILAKIMMMAMVRLLYKKEKYFPNFIFQLLSYYVYIYKCINS